MLKTFFLEYFVVLLKFICFFFFFFLFLASCSCQLPSWLLPKRYYWHEYSTCSLFRTLLVLSLCSPIAGVVTTLSCFTGSAGSSPMSSSVQTEGKEIRLATLSSKTSLKAVPDIIIASTCSVCDSVSIPGPIMTMSACSCAHTEKKPHTQWC